MASRQLVTQGKEQKAKDIFDAPRSVPCAIRFRLLPLCSVLILMIFAWSCASLTQKQNILAVVDGEPIVEEDMKYSLQTEHRKKDLSSTRDFNITQYVQKLIDDRLIIQEARRMGIEQYPRVQQAVNAYILRESVVRLHNEEIVQKVSVTEEEIEDFYRDIYESSPPEGGLKSVRRSIEMAIRKQKEKERSDEYLKQLREQASIETNQELISAINADGVKLNREKRAKDKSPLVKLNDSVLTVEDLIATDPPDNVNLEELLNRWINLSLVNNEALRRHYELRSDLKSMTYNFKNALLKKIFIEIAITPRIEISDTLLEDYYLRHQKKFSKPVLFKIQRITVKTEDDAQDVLKIVKSGGDFSWLAKRRSTDSSAQMGGDMGLQKKELLPEPVRRIVDTLKPGDISPILKINSLFVIIRLQDKTKEEIEEFDKVKKAVYRAYVQEQHNDLYTKYVDSLKAETEIKVNEEFVQSLKKRFKK